MITQREDSWTGQEENARGAKRSRATAENFGADGVCRKGQDHYDDIVTGNIGGEICHSWLRNFHQVAAGNSKGGILLDHDPSSSIEQLTRQLTQTKRRLWPAAQRCAEIHVSSPDREFADARRRCNPMEPLGEGRRGGLNQMFLNRSAVKLANIDAIMGFSITSAAVEDFLFADLAGAPGGFSEYLIKRCQGTRTAGSCRGYGMSLVGTNEHGNGTPWKLGQTCHRTGAFQANYCVSGGADGSGDLYDWANVVAFARGMEYDMQSAGLRPQKLHLVVADGGFDAQRNSERQEELAQRLILCEIAAALYLLRAGGTFLVKMFGFRTWGVRAAMRDLYAHFEQLVILKPISSRPASSERYVVCTGFRGVQDFDGARWMDGVFGRESKQDAICHSSLDKMLDEFDRDVLELNLKTCFSILSTLERKSAGHNSWMTRDTCEQFVSQLPSVIVEMYRRAWRLN